MKLTPVSLLRRACPDEPTAREVARRARIGARVLSLFENGRYEMSADRVRRYAKAIRSSELEVRRRFAMAQLAHHRAMVKSTIATLKKLGVRPKRPGKRLEMTG